MTVIATMKEAAISLSERTGVMERVRRSAWRRQRLLILCYHGVSIDDEHLWNSRLYVSPQFLRRRLDLLKRGGYEVLLLDEGLRRLRDGTLPQSAVCLTFDDGAYDFYARAFPVLQEFGYPATVYQTTYYADYNRPVFDTFASYLLWKSGRGEVSLGSIVPGAGVRDLRNADARNETLRTLLEHASTMALSGEAKDVLLVRLADLLRVDLAPLLRRRILQIMNPFEIQELSKRGIDFQLHTHRHRSPKEQEAFAVEIGDNRRWLEDVTGHVARHFCYPSGVYRRDMMEWLSEQGIESAATCDPGMATSDISPLLLPRFIDTQGISDNVFRAWASGVAELLPRRTRFAHPDDRDV